uniref:Uncharacterized protein n=1 Tax=Amphimedon queenslandica TaxID=400682 RepID=A0A1X7STR2_AMPQE
IPEQRPDEFKSDISLDLAVSLSIPEKPSNSNTTKDKNLDVEPHVKVVEIESQRVHPKICGLKSLGNTSRSSSNNEIFLTPPSGRKAFDKRDKLSFSPKSLSQD